MDFEKQKLITIVSDMKFVLIRLDETKHQTITDLVNEHISKFEKHEKDTNSLINDAVSAIEKCLSDNNFEDVPVEISDLVESLKAFLPA